MDGSLCELRIRLAHSVSFKAWKQEFAAIENKGLMAGPADRSHHVTSVSAVWQCLALCWPRIGAQNMTGWMMDGWMSEHK